VNIRYTVLGIVPLLIATHFFSGLYAQNTTQMGEREPATGKPWFKFQHVSAGAKIFKENCAACHGKQGEGAQNWRKPGLDGEYPAPPLNGTGHAWHHPLKALLHVIRNGSPGGQGNMPAWKDKLSDEQMLAAIAWFQSKWSKENYSNWEQRNATQQKRRKE